VRIFYYIAPQVWAWHPERARAMARWVDRLAVVFPFEEPLFRDAGVDATFVGHPLLEDLAPECDEPTLRAELGVGDRARLLGLLPGSRRQELHAHLPVMVSAARRLAATRPDLVAVVPLAPGLDVHRLPDGVGPPGPVRVVHGRTRAVMRHARACAVASGTATLETALFATPHVIVYRTSALNYAIARRVVRLERVGLPNIVAGADVAPELIQDAFTPAALEARLAPWLDDPRAAAEQSARLAIVRERLGGPGASGRAADLLAGMLA
jgi:lipid-A-disaccharide synthase